MDTLTMLIFLLFAFIMGAIVSVGVVLEWEEREKHKLEMEGKDNEND